MEEDGDYYDIPSIPDQDFSHNEEIYGYREEDENFSTTDHDESNSDTDAEIYSQIEEENDSFEGIATYIVGLE